MVGSKCHIESVVHNDQKITDKNKCKNCFSEVEPKLELMLNQKGVSSDEFLADHADAF